MSYAINDDPITLNEPVIKSYVWHGKDCFFVSTINRASSAALAYGSTYAETLVWRFDWSIKDRVGGILYSESGSTGSINKHVKVCEQLHANGKLDDE